MISLSISQTLFDIFIDFCRDELLRQDGFSEFGGYMMGTFDGKRLVLKGFSIDELAETSAGGIRFSDTAFDEIAAESARRKIIPIGTWHVHPPDFGSHYSRVDVSNLFLETFRITSSNPSEVNSPQAHVIVSFPNGAKGKPEARAYTMVLPRKCELRPFPLSREDEGAISGGLASSSLGLIVRKGGKLSLAEYSPDGFRDAIASDSLVGLARRYPYGVIDPDFEKIFFENYYVNSSKMFGSFIYVRALGAVGDKPIEAFDVTIERRIDRHINFDEIALDVCQSGKA